MQNSRIGNDCARNVKTKQCQQIQSKPQFFKNVHCQVIMCTVNVQ